MVPYLPVLVLLLTLGETPVNVAVHDRGEGLSLLVLHDNENTAVEAGTFFLDEWGGRLVELQAQGERRVAFTVRGQNYSVDPNRIFTDRGARLTLGEDSTSAAAVAVTRLFGDALVALYQPRDLVVTLHNNTPDNYSALSYLPGGIYEQDAEAVHLAPDGDPDDFFFVTHRGLYERLQTTGFNVVLQNNEGVTDDGSLSVWAAQQGLPYVNIEAEHGHLKTQVLMLRALLAALGQHHDE